MLKLISDIDSVKTYESRGYTIEVLHTGRRTVTHISVTDPIAHPFYPEITAHSGFYTITPTMVTDRRIDDAIEGLMIAKELLKELNESKEIL